VGTSFVIESVMDRISRVLLMFGIAATCFILNGACRERSWSGRNVEEAYSPELGELMTFQQMRHTKLWLAGQAGNWPLAAYEIDELGEGFEAVMKFHPTHEGSPVAPKTRFREWSLNRLRISRQPRSVETARRSNEPMTS